MQQEPAWETALVKAFGVHKCCYGTRRLRVELRRQGYRVGRQHLRPAMRRRGLRALQPKAFTPARPTPPTGYAAPPIACSISPSLLGLTRSRCRRGGTLVSDITYLPLANGDWAYLCAFQDMASKQVVGWHVMATMPEEL